MVDLVDADAIAWNACEALNVAKKAGPDNAVKKGLRDQELLLVESDADEQLLITLSFKSQVKVHSILIDGPTDGRAPKEIKLFVNKAGLSFDDAESGVAAQELEITPAMLGQRLELHFVKFQRVN